MSGLTIGSPNLVNPLSRELDLEGIVEDGQNYQGKSTRSVLTLEDLLPYVMSGRDAIRL